VFDEIDENNFFEVIIEFVELDIIFADPYGKTLH
jgi:hypothetical protein